MSKAHRLIKTDCGGELIVGLKIEPMRALMRGIPRRPFRAGDGRCLLLYTIPQRSFANRGAGPNCLAVADRQEHSAYAIQYGSLRIGQEFLIEGLDGKVARDPFLVEPPKVGFVPRNSDSPAEDRSAGKSTLNHLELSAGTPDRYKQTTFWKQAIDELLVQVFVDAHATAPEQSVLDIDTTDVAMQGDQEEPLLPRLLRSLLLFASVRVLWRAPGVRPPASRQHRCGGWMPR